MTTTWAPGLVVAALLTGAVAVHAATDPPAPPASVGAPAQAGGPPAAGSSGSAVTPGHRWAWPLAPVPSVTRPFRAPATAYGAGHRGADLTPAAPGAVVRAVAAGVVTHVGVVAGRGTITVTHPDGLRSTYEPVLGEVRVGQSVARGEVLGLLSGSSHCDPGPTCLHLGAARGRQYLDPLRLIVGGPVVLLPLA